jgi:hypothetical protein
MKGKNMSEITDEAILLALTATEYVASSFKSRYINNTAVVALTKINKYAGKPLDELYQLFKMVLKSSPQKDLDLVAIVDAIHVQSKYEPKEEGYNLLKSIQPIFDLLLKKAPESAKTTITALNGAFKHNKNRLHYIHAIEVVVRYEEIDLNILPISSTSEKIISNVLLKDDDRYELVPDSYVFDKHTQEGKRLGRGITHFFEVGAYVCNVGYPDTRKEASQKLYEFIEQHMSNIPRPKFRLIRQAIRNNEFNLPQPVTASVLEIEQQSIATNKVKPITTVVPYILPASPEDIEALSDPDPLYGQTVTASWKVVTVITPKYVYKGPYSRLDAIKGVVQRSERLKELGDKWFVEQQIIKYGSDLYLRSENIGSEVVDNYKWTVKKIKGDLIGRVVDRESMGAPRAIDVYRKEGRLPEEQWFGILYHFILRYVLQIADTGLWNVINGKGLDYEESRHDDIKEDQKKSLLELLMRKKPEKNLAKDFVKHLNIYKEQLVERLKRYALPHTEGDERQRLNLVLRLLQ